MKVLDTFTYNHFALDSGIIELDIADPDTALDVTKIINISHSVLVTKGVYTGLGEVSVQYNVDDEMYMFGSPYNIAYVAEQRSVVANNLTAKLMINYNVMFQQPRLHIKVNQGNNDNLLVLYSIMYQRIRLTAQEAIEQFLPN